PEAADAADVEADRLRTRLRGLVRLPGEALAVARDELAGRRQDERGVRHAAVHSFEDAAGDQPERCLARERAEPLGELTWDVDRELLLRWEAVRIDQRRQGHQMKLGSDHELQSVERGAERTHVTLELLERSGGIPGDARRLQRCDEE